MIFVNGISIKTFFATWMKYFVFFLYWQCDNKNKHYLKAPKGNFAWEKASKHAYVVWSFSRHTYVQNRRWQSPRCLWKIYFSSIYSVFCNSLA